jgi:hypothetical protein
MERLGAALEGTPVGIVVGLVLDAFAVAADLPWAALDRLIAWHESWLSAPRG